jgi:hypothetical protein
LSDREAQIWELVVADLVLDYKYMPRATNIPSNMVQWYDLVEEAWAEACVRLHAPSVNMSDDWRTDIALLAAQLLVTKITNNHY